MSRKLPKATQLKRRYGEAKRNKEAYYGKMALYASWEQAGKSDDPYCAELIDRIQKERKYFQLRSFHCD